MAKDKKQSKAAAAPVKASKPVADQKVKAGRVTKPAEKTKVAKETAKKVEKKSKKAKKEPTPEPSSDEESEDDASSASSESSSEEEAEVKPKANGAAAKKAESSDEDSDSSASDSEKPAPKKAAAAPKANGKAAAAAKKADSDSDSDDSESDSEVVEGGAAKEDDSSDSDSSDDEEAEAPKANGKAAAADSDDSDDSDDSSDSDEEEKPKAVESKKRKAEAEPAHATKKNKTEAVDESAPTGNLFVGNISWNVDEEWLTREFEEFGELAGVRIITDRDSGRSKGFGYVEFSDPQNAKKALEAKNGAELDGRELRLDFSTPRTNDGPGAGNKSNDRAARFGDTTNAPAATLFVGNISFEADENTITEYFQEHGTIKAVRLPTDRETGAPKGFGYVEMSSIEEAQAAFTALQGADIAGRPIRLDYAAERSNDGGDRGGRGGRGGGRGGFDRGGRGGGRGGFGDRGGRGGGRGFGGGRGRGGDRGGRGRPQTTNRGGFGDFSGQKISF